MNYKKLLSFIVAGMFLLLLFGNRVYAVENVYEVQKGDCLWKIAARLLGDGARYTDIVAWNEELIQDPNLIYPGMELRIAESAKTETGDSDNKETVQNTAGAYQKGTISGNTWESEWLGMQLDMPDYYEFIDVEEFYDDVGEDTYIVLPEDSARHIDWEFVAIDPTLVFSDGYVFLAVEQSDCSVSEYMEEIRTEIEKGITDGSGVNMNWSKEDRGEIPGMEYYIATVEYAFSTLTQEYYIKKKDGRIVLMCFSVETITFDFPKLPVFK